MYGVLFPCLLRLYTLCTDPWISANCTLYGGGGGIFRYAITIELSFLIYWGNWDNITCIHWIQTPLNIVWWGDKADLLGFSEETEQVSFVLIFNYWQSRQIVSRRSEGTEFHFSGRADSVLFCLPALPFKEQTVSTWGNTPATCSYSEIVSLHLVTLFRFVFLQETLLALRTHGGDEKCIESYRQRIWRDDTTWEGQIGGCH